jgi:hypothetical protein
LHLSGALGAAGMMSFPAAADDHDDGDDDRNGDTVEGTMVSGSQTSSDLVEAIGSSDIQNQVVSSAFRGATEQAEIFSQGLQGFPRSGDEFVVLSNGFASEAAGDPNAFVSTNISNGRSNQDYSPDGYDAYNIADLEVTISLSDDAEGIEFAYKFATEENPTFLNSEYQDFFEVQLFDPDGGVRNLAIIEDDPVTVENADTVSNSPGGTSENPEPPLPSPQDVRYNAVTELQTVTYDVSAYQGQEVTLVFRIADASDGVYDSAAFIDSLQFTNDVDTDPTPVRNALKGYQQSFKQYIERQFEAQAQLVARLYDEHGDDYGDKLTDYWGYQSGNVAQSAVSDGLREVGDSAISTVNEEGNLEVVDEDAQELYQFYDDLFGELNEGAPLDQLVQTATQYFLGTHPNQNNYIRFDDGKTVADGLNEDWNLSDNVYDRLTNEVDPDQSDLQRIANALDQRGDKFAARGRQDVKSKRKAAQELIGAEETSSAEVHAQRKEKPTSGQDVEAEVAVTTVAIGIAFLVGAGGLAAGYVTNKCAGAYTAARSAEGVEFNAVTLTRPDQAVIGTVTTFVNYGAAIANYGQYAAESVESQGFYTTLFASNFIAGQKAAAADLALQTGVVFSKAALSQQVSAEITELDLPDVTEREEMELFDSFLNGIKGFFDDLLGGWYDYSPPQIGAATGSVTISTENPVGDGPVTFEPVFDSDYRLYDGGDLVGTAHPFEISGDMSEMQTGEERTFDIEYKAPLDRGLLSGEGSVEFGVSPVSQVPVASKSDFLPLGVCELDFNAIGKATATRAFSVNEAIQNSPVAQGSAQDGETNTYAYTPGPDTNKTLLSLNYEGHYSDLHVYDEQNNEVGYDYSQNEVVTEIDGATYSGRDTGEENSEWVSMPVDSNTEYTVEVVTPEVGTIDQGEVSGAQTGSLVSEFETSAAEVGDLPPKLAVTPSSVSLSDVSAGDTLDLSLTVDEVNGEQAAEDVSVSAGDLTAPDGSVIPASNVSFDTGSATVSSPTQSPYRLTIPNEASGTYTGTFEVTSSNADPVTLDVEVQVADSAEGPNIQRSVSTATASPGDTVGVTVEMTATSNKVTISEFVDPPMADIAIDAVRVDGTEASPVVETAENDAVLVTLETVSAGDSITIEYTMTAPQSDSDGTVHTIKGTYTADGAPEQIGGTDVTVEEGFFEGIVSKYNGDGDDDIDITELGQAAADYAAGDIDITELSQVAGAYANTGDD